MLYDFNRTVDAYRGGFDTGNALRLRDLQVRAGQAAQGGNYEGAAQTLLGGGDFQTGIPLLATARQMATQQQALETDRQMMQLLSGGAAAPAGQSLSALGRGGDYFAHTRAAESGGDDAARNPQSTATGRYQFLRGTWDELMRSNPELGLTADGRNDPAQQERAMRAFTAQNARALQARGIQPTDANLYMAHFLGSGAAPNFINAVQQDPTVPATSLVSPQVAAANRSVFFNEQGQPRSAGEVYQNMTRRFGGASTALAAIQPTGQGIETIRGAPVATSEAQVQQLEAQMASRQPRSSQVAQAPAPGVADIAAPGAAPAQFAIPGQAQGRAGLPPGDPMPNVPTASLTALLAMRSLDDGRRSFIKSILENRQRWAQEETKLTDVQRNYAAARAQGYQGTLVDYQKELRQQVTVNNSQEREFDKKTGASVAERFAKLVDDGDQAATDYQTLGDLRQLGQRIQTGGGAAVQGWLAERGIKIGDNVGAVEAYGALIDRLTPQQRAPGSGATSDFDAKMFKASLPRLINSPEGNELVIGTLERLADNRIKRAEIAQRVQIGELTVKDGIQALRGLQTEARAMSTELRERAFRGSQPQGQQPQPPQAAPLAPGQSRVIDGVTIRRVQ